MKMMTNNKLMKNPNKAIIYCTTTITSNILKKIPVLEKKKQIFVPSLSTRCAIRVCFPFPTNYIVVAAPLLLPDSTNNC